MLIERVPEIAEYSENGGVWCSFISSYRMSISIGISGIYFDVIWRHSLTKRGVLKPLKDGQLNRRRRIHETD